MGKGGIGFTAEQFVSARSYLLSLYQAAGLQDQIPLLREKLQELEKRYQTRDFPL